MYAPQKNKYESPIARIHDGLGLPLLPTRLLLLHRPSQHTDRDGRNAARQVIEKQSGLSPPKIPQRPRRGECDWALSEDALMYCLGCSRTLTLEVLEQEKLPVRKGEQPDSCCEGTRAA